LGWDLFDYNGRKIVNHGGGADGMISKLVLVPEENLGFVILTNSINYLPTALMYQILDAYTSTQKSDWSSMYYPYYERSHDMDKQDMLQMEENRNKQSHASLSLESYIGIYGGEIYGDVEVKLENGALVLKMLPTPMFIGDLEHYQYNTFSITLRNIINLPKGTVNFILNAQGKIAEMVVDIPNPDFDFTELKFYKKE